MGFLIGLAALGGVVLAVGLSRHRIEPAEPVAPRCVEEFALRDARGQLHELKQWQAHRAVLLFVLGTECPVSNGYAPEMRRIAATYAPRGVATFGVHPDPEVSAEVAARHAAEYGLDFPVLLDPAQELVGAAGVRVTPEAVVLDPKGRVLYHGRIDDRVAPDGKRRDRPRTLDVEIALEAVLAGGVPPVAEVPAFGCPLPEPAPLLDEGETITFNKHVALILWKHCASCHRPGEVGPFPLLTYRDAAKRADFLRAITASRRMPPWKPVHGYGDFLNERRLSRRELATLARWAETGSEEGDPADLAPLPQFPEGWQIGQPDLVLTMPEPFAVPAGSDDIYRAFVLPIPLDHDQTIATVEFRPGNRRIVHHVRMYLDPTDECRRRDAADPLPGFKTFGACDIRKPGVGAWLPGMVARRPPEGVGKIVKAHSDLVVLIHYHGSGKPETDQSSVGLYFLKGPLRRSFTNIPLSTAKIDIPPGAKRHRITQTAYLVADAHAYSVMPHGHFLMREISLTATRPDGTVVPMLWIKDWDINWQGQYHFAQPIALPRGTRLDVIALYDNSDENPRNPFHPPRRVRFGPASTDEMLGCHVQVLVDHPDDQKLFDQKWPYNL